MITVSQNIFVDITKAAAPTQNGASWATAYGDLQTALAASSAGGAIWVAQGTYKTTATTTRTIYFNIPSDVKVYGGFVGNETMLSQRNSRTNVTVLSGEIGNVNTTTDNSYHVVNMDGSGVNTLLDGFTIMGGYANYDPSRVVTAPAPAPSTTSTIETGGGILIKNAGIPTIINCMIVSNASFTGGGIYAADASIPNIIACKITSNQANFGGGLYFQDGSNGNISNSLISGNSGIGAFYNNKSNPTITNCTIAGNGGYNGGIFNSSSQPVVKNTIIWGNSTPFNDTQSIITNSDIQGGYVGAGNLDIDPKFVSPQPNGIAPTLLGDYHVLATSLTIDRGDNGTISLTDLDLDGNLRRFSGGTVDMGAYEFQGAGIANVVISAQTGDWESNTTWVGLKVPQLGDIVVIDANHIVTINTTVIAKNIEYRGTGQIKFKNATAQLNIGL
jgi:parallel beta-helix repeat protein